MPVVYSSIIEEHQATRQAGGLFDISHMGRFRVAGGAAVLLLERLLTNRVGDLALGQARYSLVLDEAGCILDDILVYRFADWYLVVVNASNREKLLEWFTRHAASSDATIEDLTFQWGMIALQGPLAVAAAEQRLETPVASLGNYRAREIRYRGQPAIVSRTGYTGEDGVEVIVPASLTLALWTDLLGARPGFRAVGLGARDTLRLEAGMPLYGHELSRDIDPIQARLGWAVKSEPDFIGRAALTRRDPERRVRVGLRLNDKRIAREGFPVRDGEREVGVVTSGTFGPTVGASIAMAYLDPGAAGAAEPGRRVEVLVRGSPVPAEVVGLPFYRRKKNGHG